MDPLHTAPPELTLHAQSSSDPSRKKSFLLAQSFSGMLLIWSADGTMSVAEQWPGQWLITY